MDEEGTHDDPQDGDKPQKVSNSWQTEKDSSSYHFTQTHSNINKTEQSMVQTPMNNHNPLQYSHYLAAEDQFA